MRKLLILMLVFGLASLANATVFDVVTAGTGSLGHAGTEEDPLVESEVIAIQIVLNVNPYPGYPTYNGYVTDGFDFDLHVTGAGSLGVVMATSKTGDYVDLQHHSGLEFWSQSDPLIVSNNIASMMGGTMGAVDASEDGGGGAGVLVWNLWIHCDGYGPIDVDLTLAGYTQYWDYSYPSGDPYGDMQVAVEADLGNLTIYNEIPEPATIALLGLGSLFLMRRRRK